MDNKNKISLEVYALFIKTITESKTIDTMANSLVQLLVSALGIKGAAIYILNPELEELELLSSVGLSQDYVNKGPILVDRSIKIGANREAVIISDTEASRELQYPEKAKEEGVRAIVSYPINMRGKTIGSLRLYHQDVWEISEHDKLFIQATTQNLGLALMYFRIAHAVLNVQETVNDIHPVWL